MMGASDNNRSFTPKKPITYHYNDGNFVRIYCYADYHYYPTYNGSLFDAFKCTENGWSLPDNIQPIRCEHIKCPPLPNVGDEISLECIRRGLKCMEAATSDPQLIADDINNEIFQNCECTGARFTCKKEG